MKYLCKTTTGIVISSGTGSTLALKIATFDTFAEILDVVGKHFGRRRLRRVFSVDNQFIENISMKKKEKN